LHLQLAFRCLQLGTRGALSRQISLQPVGPLGLLAEHLTKPLGRRRRRSRLHGRLRAAFVGGARAWMVKRSEISDFGGG
jgi:hypothetical protein